MNEKFSNRIFNLNYILIIMIVILHSSLFAYCNEDLKLFFKAINTICDMATPMFFSLSAYLFYRNCDQKKINEKIKRRIKTLIIPYFLWGIILYIYYYILYRIPFTNNFFDNQFDFSIRNLPISILMSKCAMTMWFVRCLIVYTFLSPLLYIILKNKYISLTCIVILFIVNIIFSFGYSNPVFWLNVYMLGGYIAIHNKSYIENKEHDINYLKMFFLILHIVLLIFAINANEYSKIYYIYRCCSPFFIYLIFEVFGSKYTKKIKFYNYSFWIFCIHLPIVQVVRKVLLIFLNKELYLLMICYILTIIITIFLCIYTAKLTEKLLPKMYKLLIGHR